MPYLDRQTSYLGFKLRLEGYSVIKRWDFTLEVQIGLEILEHVWFLVSRHMNPRSEYLSAHVVPQITPIHRGSQHFVPSRRQWPCLQKSSLSCLAHRTIAGDHHSLRWMAPRKDHLLPSALQSIWFPAVLVRVISGWSPHSFLVPGGKFLVY